MSERTQEQGFDIWDIAAVASTLLGCVSILLVMFLPYRDMGFGIAATIATLILAITAAKFNSGNVAVWFARAGSAAGVIALAILIVGEITRNQ